MRRTRVSYRASGKRRSKLSAGRTILRRTTVLKDIPILVVVLPSEGGNQNHGIPFEHPHKFGNELTIGLYHLYAIAVKPRVRKETEGLNPKRMGRGK